ncbi:hypothetical protein HHL22_01110 [Hymenobacter sp. RP-2-7]|uniref:Uncharacterized protein n=1 Tax=Hymenobacter polaris TaxID=2682546 RepID=A0A7Y0FKK1_9BACT|nr:hypothetical protein [Hymenobacter polaris]NML63793.1 hypothetical protein [Hymenobacter polaris]
MANLFSTLLHTYTLQVLVDTTPGQPGFRIVAPGLLGKEYITSPALTARILASPEFDQLFGAERAQRILEMALNLAEQAGE